LKTRRPDLLKKGLEPQNERNICFLENQRGGPTKQATQETTMAGLGWGQQEEGGTPSPK